MMRYAERAKAFPDNMWLGVSVESAPYKFRIEHLRKVQAKIRFLSIEPLIGPVGHLDLRGIHWVIVGGESGPNFRPVKVEWIREIRDECLRQSVAFFLKQFGGLRPKSGGRELDGRTWNEFPVLPSNSSQKGKLSGAWPPQDVTHDHGFLTDSPAHPTPT